MKTTKAFRLQEVRQSHTARVYGRDNLFYPETVDATIEVRSVGLVSVPYQVPRRRVPWKSIDHLLRRPFSRRMFGDIEMNDTATVVAKDDEDEQNSEGCGRQSEKVERYQVVCMIIKKAPPSRGRWRAMANHILGDGSLGNGDAQLCQLAMHAGSSPERVGPAHVPYQLTYFGSRRLVVQAYAVDSSTPNIV